MDVEFGRHRGIDGAQEGEELPVSMTRLALRQHLAVEDVERGKQGRRTVPHVVVGDALDVAEAQWRHRLSPFQRLALALLVDAQHQRVVGRVQVQPDPIAQLLDASRSRA